MLCYCSGVEAAIPNRDHKVGCAKSQCAGQVDSIGPAQAVRLG